ncbi:12094_t:CDS:2, partial [Racocetra fulgida]
NKRIGRKTNNTSAREDCNLVRETIHSMQAIMWCASDITNNFCNADLHQLQSDVFPIWIIMKKIRDYLPPSSFALINNLIKYHDKDKQLLIHCPPECVGPPVQVYHDVFNQFLRDYHNKDLEMGKEHYQWTLELIYEMAKMYQNESERSKKFREKFRQLFDEDLKIIRLDDDSSNDGTLECNYHSLSVLRLLTEIKNEIGTGKCDPTTQAGEYYGSLDAPSNPQNSQRFFPYPNRYKQQDITIEFTYEKKLVDQPDKLLWKAITKDGREIVVKFTWRYNQRAHELCSEIGKAPKLLYINKEVVDGFYMVVMDYVKAKPLYNCGSSLTHDECKTIFEDIEEAISKLHKENIVFADLRDSNIL